MEKKPQLVVPVQPPVVEDVRAPKVDPSLSKRLEETKIVEKVSYISFTLQWYFLYICIIAESASMLYCR